MLPLWKDMLVDRRKAYDRRLQLSLLTSSFVTMLRNLLVTLNLSQRETPACFSQEDTSRLLRLMQSVYDFFASGRPHTCTIERNAFMKQALDDLEVLAVEHLVGLLLEVEEGRVTVAHCLRTTAECSSLLQVAVAGLSMQTDTRAEGQLFEETHTHHCWGDVALHVKRTPAVDKLWQYFFAKLRWRLAMRLGLWSVDQCGCNSTEAGPCTSRVTKLLHMLDGEGMQQLHHLSWVSILSNAAIVEHRRLQRLCLDEGESDALESGVSHVLYPPPAAVKAALEMNVIKVLSLTATNRIVVPQNSKLSRLGQLSTALISHVPATSPDPSLTTPTVRHPPIPSLDMSMDVYLTSLGAALASVEKWYTAGIRQSLAKWSLKQLFTLAVHDLGEASEEIARTVARRVDVPGCSELLQQCKDHLQVLQVEAAESYNRRLTRTCSAVWADIFPSAKYWKELKKPKTGGGLQTSAYIESLLEQVFLPLFEVMSVVPVEEQVVLLYWHTNLVCSGYKKAITANAKSYRQGAAQQLHHDFTEMKTWLTEAVDAFDERVKAQVSHSPALSCLAQGLSAMLGREETPSTLPPPAAGDVSSLTSGDKISPFFQHILSLPVVSDTSCMFDCTNLSEWKQCMK